MDKEPIRSTGGSTRVWFGIVLACLGLVIIAVRYARLHNLIFRAPDPEQIIASLPDLPDTPEANPVPSAAVQNIVVTHKVTLVNAVKTNGIKKASPPPVMEPTVISAPPEPIVPSPPPIVVVHRDETYTNLALNCSVSSSDKKPIHGTPDLITNGIEESDSNAFTMHRNVQWVQVDLAKSCELYYLKLWHSTNGGNYHGVVVLLSDNEDFTNQVQIVFNNDAKNTCGRGVGTDKEYKETSEGLTIPAKGYRARYIRAYSNGSTFSSLNSYCELEAYGNPVLENPQTSARK